MAQAIASPVGRFVQGDAFEAQTKDQQGNPLTVKTGPNKGQPTKRWFMAVAFPKNDPTTLPYLQKIAEEARISWPAWFAEFNISAPPLFGSSHPKMSLKIMDGDSVDDNGKPNNQKDGFAGCWVVKYGTSIQAPEVYHAGKYDPMERVTDPRELPRGFYVRIFGGFESNKNDQRPGLFVNLSKVEIARPGDVIVSGPSAADAFGGANPAQPGLPAQNHAPTPPTPPVASAALAGLTATGKDGQTIEGLRAAGWSDDQMVQGGYATRPAAAPAAPQPPAPPSPPTPPAPPAAPYSGYMQAPDPAGPPASRCCRRRRAPPTSR